MENDQYELKQPNSTFYLTFEISCKEENTKNTLMFGSMLLLFLLCLIDLSFRDNDRHDPVIGIDLGTTYSR